MKNFFIESDNFEEFEDFENHIRNIINSFIKDFFADFLIDYDEEVNEESLPEELFTGKNFIDKKTGAYVKFLPLSYFPASKYKRVLGFYNLNNHTIYLPYELTNNKKLLKFIFYHEQAHASGIMNEKNADRYAKEKLNNKNLY